MTTPPVKILVVDDLPPKLLVYRSILEAPGLEVITAASGPEALREVLRHDLAVILLDVNMPGMDGLETASLIRTRRRCAHTPIIFVTAFADEVHAIKGYSQGAVDYILSPVSPEILRTKVQVFVQLFRLTQQVRERAARQLEQSEFERTRLAAILASATDFVARLDRAGRVLEISEVGRRMLGYGAPAVPPAHGEDLHLDPGEAVPFPERLARAAADGVWFAESALRTRQGEAIPVAEVILAHREPSGEVESFSLIARDITARRRAERAVVASEQRYRQLVENLPAAVYACDSDGRITLYNDAAVELWGRAPVVGSDRWCGSWKILRADGTPLAPDECPTALTLRQGRPPAGMEIIVERPDGSRRHVIPNPHPILDGAGAVVGAINMLVDITERKQAEKARGLLAAIVDTTDDAILSITLDGVITSCNAAGARLYGYAVEELVGAPVATLIPPDRRAEAQGILDRLRRGERVVHFETVRVARDGRRIDVSLTESPVVDSAGRVVGASKIVRDITESKRAERALRERESRLRAMFGQAAVGIALTDPEGGFLEVNERLAQILRTPAPALRARSFQDLTHPEDWPAHRRLLEDVARGERPEYSHETRCLRADGSWVWVNVTVSPLLDDGGGAHRLMAVFEDISARKAAEHELQRHREHLDQLVLERTAELEASHERMRLTDRLAAIGTLTAGLGHDMGNLLLPIRMRLETLEALPLPAPAREDIAAIRVAAEYLRRLSQGLRHFAVNPEDGGSDGQATALAPWWRDVVSFLQNAVPKSVTLEGDLAEDLPPVAMPPHRLTQVVFNLVQNAGDSLRDRASGWVRVSAALAGTGREMELTVADNGCGMSDEVRRRCMDPFFTTKTRAISTGLGLALVLGAVLGVGGSIEIDSAPGRGTSFRLRLPVAVRGASGPAALPAPTARVAVAAERVRAYIVSVLQSLGVAVPAGGRDGSSDLPVRLLVADREGASEAEVRDFLGGDAARRAVLIGAGPAPGRGARTWRLEAHPAPWKLRQALAEALAEPLDLAQESLR